MPVQDDIVHFFCFFFPEKEDLPCLFLRVPSLLRILFALLWPVAGLVYQIDSNFQQILVPEIAFELPDYRELGLQENAEKLLICWCNFPRFVHQHWFPTTAKRCALFCVSS